jgi:hypothetical protein
MQSRLGNNKYKIVGVSQTGFLDSEGYYCPERKCFMADTALNRNTVIANVATAFIASTLLRAGALLFAPQRGRKKHRDILQFSEKAGNSTDGLLRTNSQKSGSEQL